MENDLSVRKRTRLQGFDYNTVGAYFLTVCTQNRRNVLSRIVGVDVLDDPLNNIHVNLLPYGEIADRYINQLNDFYKDIVVDSYVIMPNHIHIMLFVLESGSSRTSTPTKQHSSVSRFVSTFKRFCNKEYGCNIWQRYFNDHIIRDHDDYEAHLRYIQDNPMRWQYDELYTSE
jgi:REP element-mobilizing transposase RayT